LNRHWPDTLANGAMAYKIFGRNRLFHPGQIEILEPTDALDRAGSALRLPRASRRAGLILAMMVCPTL
jgi:hypothetical protein